MQARRTQDSSFKFVRTLVAAALMPLAVSALAQPTRVAARSRQRGRRRSPAMPTLADSSCPTDFVPSWWRETWARRGTWPYVPTAICTSPSTTTPRTTVGGCTCWRCVTADGDGARRRPAALRPHRRKRYSVGRTGNCTSLPTIASCVSTSPATSSCPRGPRHASCPGCRSGGDHHRKTVVLDGNGAMFVNHRVGDQQLPGRRIGRLESPGVDPCPELPTRAGVWRFSATAVGQTLATGERVSRPSCAT